MVLSQRAENHAFLNQQGSHQLWGEAAKILFQPNSDDARRSFEQRDSYEAETSPGQTSKSGQNARDEERELIFRLGGVQLDQCLDLNAVETPITSDFEGR